MCGIAGVVYSSWNDPPPPEILEAMAGAIAHRGPDADGFLSEPGVGLAHRRLSIIDLAYGGQPISNEDGSVQVILNGEIYNYRELRALLEKWGHRFGTRSDTEVLVHLYEERGARLVEHLRGMFAFALWDGRQRKVLLARDRVGLKPLYYRHDSDKIVFGSELKAILAFPGVPREIDPRAVEDFLAFGMVPGPRTIFKDIHKLPPGHLLELSAASWNQQPRQYWALDIAPDPGPTAAEWMEAIRAKLQETVKLHLVSDVPVGAFLSGGVDSSAVVATAAGCGAELTTFSIGFEEQAYSELPYAREVAARYGIRHVEEVVTPDAAALVEELSRYYDEPFADSSALPTYLVSRLASRHVKVVLSGDGGDEAFGGYGRYAHDLKEAKLRGYLPRWLRRGVLGPLSRVWPKADWLPRLLRAKTLLTNLSLDPGSAYANTLSWCRQPLRRRLLAASLTAGLNRYAPEDRIQAHFRGRGDLLDRMIAVDAAVLLPDDFLVKVDRASMAHGLEVRPPLLDHEFLELAARIPSNLKVCRGRTKWIFKEAMRPEIPAGVLDRPKQGFEIPVDAWLRRPLRELFESSVLKGSSHLDGLIDRGVAGKIYRAHLRFWSWRSGPIVISRRKRQRSHSLLWPQEPLCDDHPRMQRSAGRGFSFR